VQPRAAIASSQALCASLLNTGSRPPQHRSLSSRMGWRISAGQFASSQARVSRRKPSRSAIGHLSFNVNVNCPARTSKSTLATSGFVARAKAAIEGATPAPGATMPEEPAFTTISYQRFLDEVETIARALLADSWRPDFLVGIGRGGLVPAAYLSHRTGLPMLSVDHSSGEPDFADELLARLAARI